MESTQLNISPSDFNQICRICAEFSEKFVSVSLYNIIEMLKACASIEIFINDDLPKQICSGCLTRLQNNFEFYIKCRRIDTALRELLKVNRPSNTIFVKEESTDVFEENYDNHATIEEDSVYSIKVENSTNEELQNTNRKQVKRKPKRILRKKKTDKLSTEALRKKELKKNSFDDQTQTPPTSDDDLNRDYNQSHSHNEKINSTRRVLKKKTQKTVILDPNEWKPARKLSFHFSCEQCDEKFYQAAHLGKHMNRVHKAQGTKCELCPVVTYHPAHTTSHMKAHEEARRYECNICKKEFSTLSNLDRHQYAHTTERPYVCSQCDHSFKDKWSLERHIKDHADPEKYATCSICGKSVTRNHLPAHLLTHKAERPMHSCPICNKTLYMKSALNKHIRHVHEGVAHEYKHLCNICGRSVDSAARLKTHFLTHTGEKPFPCDRCEKTYRTKWALKVHMMGHLNKKNFMCSVCSHGFYEGSALKRHMRKHTGERPFKCTLCDKCFSFSKSLKTHSMKVHSMQI